MQLNFLVKETQIDLYLLNVLLINFVTCFELDPTVGNSSIFTVDECIEKNSRDIIDSREVIEIRHPEGFGELKPEQEEEYYKQFYPVHSVELGLHGYIPWVFYEVIEIFPILIVKIYF